MIASAIVLAAGCVDDGRADSSLRVVNSSDFVIVALYLTDVGSSTWGSNLLDGDALYPNEELTLDVSCGYYDALLVDEQGVDCEVRGVNLCLNDATWVIRNNTCTVFEAGRKARARAAAAAARAGQPAEAAPTATP